MEHDDTKYTENRERCIQCQYYGCNVCPLLADVDVFKIDKCILEYDAIKSVQDNSLDAFVFFRNPKEYLSYLGYKEKENYPKQGDTVVTLTSGFGTRYSGKLLSVDSEDNMQIFLSDNHGKYSVSKARWWARLFKIE